MDQTVQRSNVAELAPAEVHEARQLLADAEAVHEREPQSNLERHLANLAAAKFDIATAEAHRRGIETRLAQARPMPGGDQHAALEAERKARMEAEQQAQDALKRLEDVASVRETEEGTVITLTGAVLFEFDQSELLPIAEEKLGDVAEALKAQEGEAPLVIEGHADSQGPGPYNDKLSLARANAVKAFLVEHGVPEDRIKTVGRGEREPIATNETPEGRANNRRVEIVLQDEA
jgi:outer membrane protein OmpA-like peptidoglycan-associated protein